MNIVDSRFVGEEDGIEFYTYKGKLYRVFVEFNGEIYEYKYEKVVVN